ncbi:MAG: outer membrane lipoprotein carrier protein LolA [Bacteroidales bacterium]|jgi:outer membrane lipoprotein-sorting protein|nr:outer membrane lipoprotein carrier protein LolA [Bacteroidales bacterium]
MKKIIFSAVALFATLSSIEAQLKNANNSAELNSIKSANEKVQTIQCQFKRTQKMSYLNSDVTSQGDFYFTKADKLSMLYSDGEKMIINGDKVAIGKDGKVRNMKSKNHHVEDLSSTLLSCMAGSLTDLEGSLKSAKKGAKEYVVEIAVNFKVGRSKISNLELKYDAKDLTLNSLKMIEEDGSYTLYELQKKTLNKEINNSVYSTDKK